MLSYAAQFNQSTIAVWPTDPATELLLGQLGNLLVVEQEAAFELATVAGCVNGWLYFFAHDMQEWFVKAGVPTDAARLLVFGNFNDCVASALRQPQQDLRSLREAIATPGTYTAAGLELLQERSASNPWSAAFESVYERLLAK